MDGGRSCRRDGANSDFMSMNYSEAINNAMERTKYLLWERRSRVRWRNFGILSFLCGPNSGGGGGGGGGDFSQLFKGSGDHRETSMRMLLGCSVASALGAQAADLGGEKFMPYLGLIILVGLGLFALGLVCLFASNFARLILVENIVHDRDAILEPWSRLSRLGWSVLWWGFGFFVMAFVVAAILIGGPAAAIGVMSAKSPGAALLFLPLLLWMVVVMLPLGFINGYYQEIVIPLMYRQNCSATEAWALFKPLFNAQKGKWLLYMVIHCLITMAGGIAAGLAALMVMIALGLVLGVPTMAIYAGAGPGVGLPVAVVAVAVFVVAMCIVGALFNMPVTVAARSFSMYILQQVAPEYGFLPLGGRPVPVEAGTGLTGANASPGIGLNPAETQPMDDWSQTPPTQE